MDQIRSCKLFLQVCRTLYPSFLTYVLQMAPVVQTIGDVFAYKTSLAHAVSAEFHMSKGIAVQFKEYFGGVEQLCNQGKRVGEVAYLAHQGRYIFYLITKQNYWERQVSIDALHSCLINLRELCSVLGVKSVAMPRIGCGLDLLKFESVLPRIVSAFAGSDVLVKVVTPLPQVAGFGVAGDSQALRFLFSCGMLPPAFPSRSRQCGLCCSGSTVADVLKALTHTAENSLGNVFICVGTNDILQMAKSEQVNT